MKKMLANIVDNGDGAKVYGTLSITDNFLTPSITLQGDSSENNQPSNIKYSYVLPNGNPMMLDAISLKFINGVPTLILQSDEILMNTNEIYLNRDTHLGGDIYLPTINQIHLDGITDPLPAIPTDAGTYVLKAIVDANGYITFTWVAA